MSKITLEQFKENTFVPNEFYDYLRQITKALEGDVEISITPAEADKLEPTVAQANDDYAFDATIQVVDGDGNVHRWYNGTLQVVAVVASTSGTVGLDGGAQGTADANVTIASKQFVNGEAVVSIVLGGTWVENDTIKMNVDADDKEILGYAVKVANHDLLDVDA